MNILVTWNGADITNSVIEYSREQDICTGIGTLDMTVEAKTARDFMPWNTIIVWENGNKEHTYNIASAEEQIPGAIYVVSCQDDSKRLSDYFIDAQYEITYPSTAKYWIEKFLNEAGVTYNFNVSGSGNLLSENTTLGMCSAYDAILQLLQMCGWYFYFDNNNICQIGKLDVNSGNTVTFYGNEIIKLGYTKSDKMLRNRAVVWGAGDPVTQQWIYADTSIKTAWNRPGDDYRTVVYANGLIKTFQIAYSLAAALLTEFSKTIPEKIIQVIDSHTDIFLGCVVQGITNKLTLKGMVTHILVNMSSEGLISTYTIDQRCPRLFGYVNWGDYIYIGTQGCGVWRKYLTSPTWINYSTGITDLNIKDLSAYDGLLGTISMTVTPPSGTASGEYNPIIDSQLYVRHTSLASWSVYDPGGFYNASVISGEPVFLSSGYIAEACSIDETYGINGLVTVAYTIPGSGLFVASGQYYAPSGNLSWVQGITLDRVPIYSQQITITDSGTYPHPYDIAVVDMDTNWEGNNLISVYNGKNIEITIPSGGNPTRHYDFGNCISVGQITYNLDVGYVPTAQSPSVIVTVPPPNNGITLTVASGYDIFSVYMASDGGGFVLEDDLESDGRTYGYNSAGDYYIEKYIFHFASGISNWKTHLTYPFLVPETYDEGMLAYDGTLYKINENLFTLTRINWELVVMDGINYYPIMTSHASITVDDITGSGIWGDFSTGEITFNEYVGDIHPFGYATNIGGDYGGVIYLTDYDSVVQGGFAVVSLINGHIIYNNLAVTSPASSAYYIYGFDGGQSIHQSYFTLLYSDDDYSDGGANWEGFTIYPIALNKYTGEVVINTFSYIPGGPGYPYWGGGISKFIPVPYRNPSFTQAYEDPITGRGIAHCIVGLKHTRMIWHSDLNHEYFIVYTLFDILIDSYTGTQLHYIVWNDIWDASNSHWESRGTPEWIRVNGASSELLATCSSADITPAGMKVYDIGDTNERLALVDPWDLETIVSEFQSVTWNENEYKASYILQKMDDIDDTLYVISTTTASGVSPLTVGYSLEGNATKILFPDYSGLWGTPLHDKIVVKEQDPSTIYFYIPTFIESGRSRIEDTYLILNHIPASGRFDVIYKNSSPLMIDTSKNIPTVIYQQSTHDDVSNFMARSFLNEDGSFKPIYPMAPVYDARTFDLSGDLSFFPASGIASGVLLDRYVGVAAGNYGLLMYNSEFANNAHTLLYSGAFTHLDFTNTYPDPYMFVCTSGISTSGRFFQRDTEEIFWNDYSSTLPSGEITIVRADDRM